MTAQRTPLYGGDLRFGLRVALLFALGSLPVALGAGLLLLLEIDAVWFLVVVTLGVALALWAATVFGGRWQRRVEAEGGPWIVLSEDTLVIPGPGAASLAVRDLQVEAGMYHPQTQAEHQVPPVQVGRAGLELRVLAPTGPIVLRSMGLPRGGWPTVPTRVPFRPGDRLILLWAEDLAALLRELERRGVSLRPDEAPGKKSEGRP